MTPHKDFLDRMRIASPCNVGWEKMTGDERTRFCAQCKLHVYNISSMTRSEVASLIANTEGRICARLYRRADGTVLTRDCPVGLRAFRKRMARMAGAALATILSLCAGAAGQSKSQKDKTCEVKTTQKIKREVAKDGPSTLTGVVLDHMGAIIAGAQITLVNEETKKELTVTSTDEGTFSFPNLAAGKYSLEIEAANFKTYKLTELVINSKEVLQMDAALEVNGETVTVGILVADPQLEHTNGTTIFRGEILQRLPLP